MSEPKDPEFYRLLRKATKEGLSLVENLVKRGEKFPRYEYFKMDTYSHSGKGLPFFSPIMKEKGPNDYKNAFGDNESFRIRIDKLESVTELLKYVRSNIAIRNFYTDTEPKYREVTVEIGIHDVVKTLVDRYIHLYDRFDLVDRLFLKIYLPIETYIYSSDLAFDVVIPILFLGFDFEETSFPQFKVEIVRMSEKFQRARIQNVNVWHRSQIPTIGAATHAIVFKKWYTEKSINDLLTGILFNEILPYDEKPKYYADCFFAALRIATDCNTGYAQVLLRPDGWANDYTADLPDLKGASLDNSHTFLHYASIPEQTKKLNLIQTKMSVNIFANIISSKNNKLRIAINRLNLCYERQNEEDAIIDATIGIEALLSDDNNQEIIHKLALRIAALSELDTLVKEDAKVIFKQVKEIYSFRSAVVHGSAKSKDKREIKLSKKTVVPTVKKGMEYLRMIIRVLLNHPRYQDPRVIDSELLLGRMNHELSRSKKNVSKTLKSRYRK
ncbi:MAG TPA: hypothetical protein VMM58_09715 [Bacteroidota bacterium]|nr:hypothetical protein [Bacteroidota bacterium]